MKIEPLIILFSLALSGVLCGCAEGNKLIEPCPHYNRLQIATFYGTNQPIKKPYGTAVPFYNPSEVGHPYQAIAFMSCEGKMSEEAGILKAMLYRAADLGADGILLNARGVGQQETMPNAEGPRSGENINVNIRWGWMSALGGDRYVFRAQAIRFKNAP